MFSVDVLCASTRSEDSSIDERIEAATNTLSYMYADAGEMVDYQKSV